MSFLSTIFVRGLSAFVSVEHAGHVTREKLEAMQAATVVSKGGKKLVKVENKRTFDQELVKTWQNAGKRADLRSQVFFCFDTSLKHSFNS